MDSVRVACEHVFVPWVPRYTASEARTAVENADCWADVLDSLGIVYHGKSIKTLRKWCARWEIATAHLNTPRHSHHRYSEQDARRAIAESRSWAETLRKLGYCHTGANPKTLKKRAREWGIPTDHFDRYAGLRQAPRRRMPPLEEILVEGSSYSRAALKRRLYEAGLKKPECELCGQGDYWRGTRISLILDHINGVRNDNRLVNLRIVCPNCAATLETHCGRGTRRPRAPRTCVACGHSFLPNSTNQRYCSRECGSRYPRRRRQGPRKPGLKRPGARRIERPPREQLLAEIEELGYAATGRRYGVSDNAIRKWIREYERERALSEGRDPSGVQIPTRTWPRRQAQPSLLDRAA